MIMSNFISEAERHEELYCSYSTRHRDVLSEFNKIKSNALSNSKIQHALVANGVTCNEIEWLKRTGHFLPSH